MEQVPLVAASLFPSTHIVFALCVVNPRIPAWTIPACLSMTVRKLAAEHSERRLRVFLYQPHSAHRFLKLRLRVLRRAHRIAGAPLTDANLLGLFGRAVTENELVIAYPREFARRGQQ